MPMGECERPLKDPRLDATEACADAAIVRQASLAGGLGACYAPSGEREGQSPLASCIRAAPDNEDRGKARSHPRKNAAEEGARAKPAPTNNNYLTLRSTRSDAVV